MSEHYLHQQYCFSHCHDVSCPLPCWRGSGYFRSVCPRRGMLLFLEEYQLNQDMYLVSDSMPRCLSFSYCMSGRVKWSIDGVPQQFSTQKGQCEIVSSGNTSGKGRYEPGEPLVIVNILLCLELLRSFFDAPVGDPRAARILRPPEAHKEILYQKRSISNAEQRVLEKLLRAPCRSMADRLFIQSKAMELVSLYLNEPESFDRARIKPPTPTEAKNITDQAKAILRSHMQSPPTIPHLARMIGTNETKLKKCFRIHLGTTVFGYLTSCRMQRACELLEAGGLTMSQVGAELGYSERTHFTRAFSRYFDMPPSQYRRDHQMHPAH